MSSHILLRIFFFFEVSKCSFVQQQIEYLGHIISSHGVSPRNSKIEAMVNWPPKTIK